MQNFSKKSQMKIQQMAFMLVAVMIFFAMVAIIYFSLSLSGLENSVAQLEEEEAREIVRAISGTPELAFTSSSECSACIDFDRAFQLSKSDSYKKNFWGLDYLAIEKIHSNGFAENAIIACADYNYPDRCNLIVLVSGPKYATKTAFVSLAKWDESLGNYRYDLGKIHASSRIREQNE